MEKIREQDVNANSFRADTATSDALQIGGGLAVCYYIRTKNFPVRWWGGRGKFQGEGISATMQQSLLGFQYFLSVEQVGSEITKFIKLYCLTYSKTLLTDKMGAVFSRGKCH